MSFYTINLNVVSLYAGLFNERMSFILIKKSNRLTLLEMIFWRTKCQHCIIINILVFNYLFLFLPIKLNQHFEFILDNVHILCLILCGNIIVLTLYSSAKCHLIKRKYQSLTFCFLSVVCTAYHWLQ
jgi:lysylphosphatidylglycerol synthetase-like protein (DUF2156 family)